MTLFGAFEWPGIAGSLALLNIGLVVVTLVWILAIKREPTSAIAWCLLVIFLPLFGILFFILFGYQSVQLPLKRKRRHAQEYRQHAQEYRQRGSADQAAFEAGYEGLAALAVQLGSAPLLGGNAVQIYHCGEEAYGAMLAAIAAARQHIHMQFFIVRGDTWGMRFMNALADKARAGVRVRFLYDAVGSWSLRSGVLRILTDAGGQVVPFLTLLNPLRRRIQINLRNHRKIMVVDGRIGFTGGLNLGDEYTGQVPFFGPWRDDFLRLEGPSVAGLQRIFVEDWDFSAREELDDPDIFPRLEPIGDVPVQVVWSGPDQDVKTIREVYLAAIMRARRRIWLATPYFVPDAGLLDALCLAARLGRDVRILTPFRPDKWIPHLAGRFLWSDLLRSGARIYQYTAGFLHLKLLLIDDRWASVGSPNFDNRSLHLNFEATCLIESQAVQSQLERAFLNDLAQSIQLRSESFSQRPFVAKMAENACRLLSPIL